MYYAEWHILRIMYITLMDSNFLCINVFKLLLLANLSIFLHGSIHFYLIDYTLYQYTHFFLSK